MFLNNLKKIPGTSLSEAGLENKMRPLIGHRILYPDGTMNSYVQRYLREKVINIFKRKTRIFTKTNE